MTVAEATLTEAEYLYAILTGGEVPEDASGMGFVPPAGGGQGQRLSQEQIATAQASSQERGGNFIQPGLLNALIEFLQKAGS